MVYFCIREDIMKTLLKKYIPRFIFGRYYFMMEFLAALRYGFPGKKLKCIGITGTKGKSTTAFLITRILEEAGLNVASISSIEFRIKKKSRLNELKMTLPSRFMLQEFLKEAEKEKVDYVVIECTSEGLAQHRVDFVHFAAAVFTNLAPEHIESHGSYGNYRKAKRRLFELLDDKGVAVANKDDKEAEYFLEAHSGKKIFYSLKDNAVKTPLFGEFNQYNALAARALCKELGVKEEIIKNVFESVPSVPGRLEEIFEGQNFRVFVDYAHNPLSLEAVLTAVLRIKSKESRVIVITGAQGGGRDKWKRPEMGKIAATYADVVIITNEDPYQENPEKIIGDVYKGIKKQELRIKEVLKILDRREAIEKALRMACENDIVIITGKGSETVMETREGKIPWNEREIVQNTLKQIIINKPNNQAV